MPRDLFGDVVVRPASTQAHRSPVLLLSLGAHGAALLLGVVGSLVATGALPSPRRALAYQHAMFTVPAVDIALPSQPPAVRSPRRATAPTTARTVFVPAPIEPPRGIVREDPDADLGIRGGTDLAPIERPGRSSLDGLVPGTQLPPPPPAVSPLAQPTRQAVRLHSGIRAPQKIFNVDPTYPAIARTARVEGMVILEATVDTSGTVTGLRVLRSDALLEQAAIDAVQQWRFTPALLNGDPIAVIMTITVRFTLGSDAR